MDKYFTIIALSVANLKQYVEFLELISFNKIHIISTKLNRNLCHDPYLFLKESMG